MKKYEANRGLFPGGDIATTVKYRLKREIATGGMGSIYEAVQYGADFVRGMKVVESNKVALLVSGTASITAIRRFGAASIRVGSWPSR